MAVARKLGEILVRYYRVPSSAVDAALASQRGSRARLGETLLRDRALSEDDLVRALAYQHGLPIVFRIPSAVPSREALAALPAWLVAWERVVPIAFTKAPDGRRRLVVATADPERAKLRAELEKLSRCPVQVVLTREDEILAAMKRFYGTRSDAGAAEDEPTPLAPTVPRDPGIEWDTVTGAQ